MFPTTDRLPMQPYLNVSPSYSQQLPLPVHVLPHTRQVLSSTSPKKIGLGMNDIRLSTIMPKPIDTALSFSSTQRTDTRKLLARPVAPENFRKHITTRKVMNSFWQFSGHGPAMADPPSENCSEEVKRSVLRREAIRADESRSSHHILIPSCSGTGGGVIATRQQLIVQWAGVIDHRRNARTLAVNL